MANSNAKAIGSTMTCAPSTPPCLTTTSQLRSLSYPRRQPRKVDPTKLSFFDLPAELRNTITTHLLTSTLLTTTPAPQPYTPNFPSYLSPRPYTTHPTLHLPAQTTSLHQTLTNILLIHPTFTSDLPLHHLRNTTYAFTYHIGTHDSDDTTCGAPLADFLTRLPPVLRPAVTDVVLDHHIPRWRVVPGERRAAYLEAHCRTLAHNLPRAGYEGGRVSGGCEGEGFGEVGEAEVVVSMVGMVRTLGGRVGEKVRYVRRGRVLRLRDEVEAKAWRMNWRVERALPTQIWEAVGEDGERFEVVLGRDLTEEWASEWLDEDELVWNSTGLEK